MRTRTRMTAQVLVGGLIAAALVWVQPAVAVTAPQTLAEQLPVQAGPVEPGFPIGHVGVIWSTDGDRGEVAEPSGGEPHGAVRFRRDGAWGPWTPLVEDGIDAPGQWASGLVDGGRADAYQVRGVPTGVGAARAVAINTTDGPPVTVGTRPGGAAQAVDSTRCRSRADWGADESLRFEADGSESWTPEFHPAQVMTVHHTATTNYDPDPAATVRAIYRYHAVDQGWGDIGYQYLVDESGTVYEGRWSGTTSPSCSAGGDGSSFAHDDSTDRMVTGAHTGGWNSGNLGVSLLGEFTTHRRTGADPAPEAVEALEDLLAELSVRHGLDPTATVEYVNPVSAEVRTVPAIAGHRDYTPTECPGARLYGLLPAIRQDVATKAGAPTDTAPTAAVSSPADGSTVSGNATLTAAAADDTGVVEVAFSVDGTSVGVDVSDEGGWSVPWDTTQVTDGSHTVTATATDTSGQTGSGAVVVQVDNVASAGTVHVADLDGTSRSSKRQWSATAHIAVAGLDGTEATVEGTWTTTGTQTSCVTSGGTCSVDSPPMSQSTGSVAFTVTDVRHTDRTYDASLNTDPDGDSNGTTIAITKG